MSILNTLLAGPSEAALEMKAAEPLIKAKAAAETKATNALAARENFSALTNDFIKIYEVSGGKNLGITSLEDILAGIEMLAESQARVSKTLSS